MSTKQVEESSIPIGGQLLVQPKTTHIPELQNETSFKIYELKATLKVKKKFLTETINEADKEKGKLEKKLGAQETRLDSY